MYDIEFQKEAEIFFDNLDKQIKERIGRKVEQLKQNPKLGKPLTGNLSGLWKLRMGKYRAIYKIVEDKLLILVLDIGHRKNVYRR